MNTRLIAVETPGGNDTEKAGVAGLAEEGPGLCAVCRGGPPSLRPNLHVGDLSAKSACR